MTGGVLVVDKPAGPTSFDVVRRLKRLLRASKVGHAGTLDPAATGVLAVCLEDGVKIQQFLADADKAYEATFAFGEATDTEDADGRVVARADASAVTEEALLSVFPRFLGDIEQVPPMYSAVRVGGRRLHEAARAGEEVERTPRRVRVDELTLLSLGRAGSSVPGLPRTVAPVLRPRSRARPVREGDVRTDARRRPRPRAGGPRPPRGAPPHRGERVPGGGRDRPRGRGAARRGAGDGGAPRSGRSPRRRRSGSCPSPSSPSPRPASSHTGGPWRASSPPPSSSARSVRREGSSRSAPPTASAFVRCASSCLRRRPGEPCRTLTPPAESLKTPPPRIGHCGSRRAPSPPLR